MRGLVLFVAGVLVGAAVHTGMAQVPAAHPAARLNHVGMSVPDLSAALAWYSDTMGFKEVIRNTNPQGQVMSAYIQVSRDTFLELQQANAQRPPGINHFGLEVGDIKGAVGAYRGRGATSTDPNGPSAFTGGILANVTAPGEIRIELSEQPPDGKLRKATESWKQ